MEQFKTGFNVSDEIIGRYFAAKCCITYVREFY